MKNRYDLMNKWAPLLAKEWTVQATIVSACMQEASDRYKEYLQDADTIGLAPDAAGLYWQAICDRAWTMIGGKLPIPQPLP